MIKLSDYANQEIRLLLKVGDQEQGMNVILRGVDFGGILIEAQQATEFVLEMLKKNVAPRTPLMFFPYHEIVSIIVPMDSPAISEKGFGV
jgi:hypothetical protein